MLLGLVARGRCCTFAVFVGDGIDDIEGEGERCKFLLLRNVAGLATDTCLDETGEVGRA